MANSKKENSGQAQSSLTAAQIALHAIQHPPATSRTQSAPATFIQKLRHSLGLTGMQLWQNTNGSIQFGKALTITAAQLTPLLQAGYTQCPKNPRAFIQPQQKTA